MVRPPSKETFMLVVVPQAATPELPVVPAACITEPEYISPYAPRNTVLLSILYAKPNRGPTLLRSVGVWWRPYFPFGPTNPIAPTRLGYPGTRPAIGDFAFRSK